MSINTIKQQIKITNNNDDLNKIKDNVNKLIENKNGNEEELNDILQKINDKIQPHLPKILLDIKNYILERKIECSKYTVFDGRTNSCIDENKIVSYLMSHSMLKERVRKAEKRFWYDIKVYDEEFGWIPVNIKTTTLQTADNVGNMSICVQAFTNIFMDMEERQNNGQLTTKLISRLKNKDYNDDFRKDYFFLVINKDDPRDIIVNSVLGISNISPNVNNLPFQVKWINNSKYTLQNLHNDPKECVKMRVLEHLRTMQKKSVKTWQEKFLSEFREMSLDD
tara:strand:+ start:1970 stop:2809 length:840 start_codon:yes stop_codon:yes gene_type:complete